MKRPAIAGVVLLLLIVFSIWICSGCGERKEARKDNIAGLTEFAGPPPPGVSEDLWKSVPTTPGHTAHVLKERMVCATCHHTDDFTILPDPKKCYDCHKAKRYISDQAKNHCWACHVFKVQKTGLELVPEKIDCQTCHEEGIQKEVNSDFFAPEAAMAISCQSCHNPHKKDFAIDNSSCLMCHAVFRPGQTSNPGHASCMQCHKPHSWRVENKREFCTVCHSQVPSVLEHNFPFHPKDCGSCHNPHYLGDFKTGTCTSCHEAGWKERFASAGIPEKHKDCLSCHAPTTWKTGAPGKCLTCHAAKLYTGAVKMSAIPAPHKQCLRCHVNHTWFPKKPPASCRSCHASIVKDASRSKMQNCTICHNLHEGTFKGWQTCATCHHDPAKNAKDAPAKADCSLCHNPHTWKPLLPDATNAELANILQTTEQDVVKKQADKTLALTPDQLASVHTLKQSKFCGQCHADVRDAGLATANEVKADCSLCHSDHKWHPDAAICASCHKDVAEASEKAGMPMCMTCHADHTWKPESPAPCISCHPSQVEAGKATQDEFKANCVMCHEPHTWAPTLECASCHSDKADEMAGTPHVSCSFCHADHNWKPAPADTCGKCHTDIAATNSKTAMADCTLCHAPHKFSKDPAAMPSCLMCHSDKKVENESSIKNNCMMCHATHDWKGNPESCAACHADMIGEGLHVKDGHRSCMTCHGNHVWREVPRSACQMCHADKDDTHYPGKSCRECHYFKK